MMSKKLLEQGGANFNNGGFLKKWWWSCIQICSCWSLATLWLKLFCLICPGPTNSGYTNDSLLFRRFTKHWIGGTLSHCWSFRKEVESISGFVSGNTSYQVFCQSSRYICRRPPGLPSSKLDCRDGWTWLDLTGVGLVKVQWHSAKPWSLDPKKWSLGL
jgi:hypothetical protein